MPVALGPRLSRSGGTYREFASTASLPPRWLPTGLGRRPLVGLEIFERRGPGEFLGSCGDHAAIGQDRRHRPFGLDAQAADAGSDRQGIAPPAREPLHRFVVRTERGGDLLGDAVQVAEAHAYLVAQLAGEASDFLRILPL